MGSEYKWTINPFQDFMMASILNGVNISKKEFEPDMYSGLITILNYVETKEDCVQYMDFEIKKRKNYYRVIGNNLISSLWLSGIFPDNPHFVAKKNEFVFDNTKYIFNVKTKKLVKILIKK